MNIFSSNKASVEAWGPTASVNVDVSALGSVVNDSWLLTGMAVGAREIVDVRNAFDDVSYIYALGNNQAQCSLTLIFTIFIGRKDCSGGDDNTYAIMAGLDAYVQNRISEKTSATTIAIGSFARMGWLVGIDIGDLDASKGICRGTAHFVMELDK